jgi:hypothetical protein
MARPGPFAGAWPQGKGEFADKMNSMPKYVVTSTLKELDWNNSTPISGDIAEEVAQQDGGPILVAGTAHSALPGWSTASSTS